MKVRILVIDDESEIRNLLKEVLLTEGYEVAVTSNGAEALEVLKKQSVYDIVLTDIRMPTMDGIELMNEIRKSWPDIAIIIMTGYADINSARIAIKQGAYDYIRKPFNISEMMTAIENTLKRLRLSRENARLRELVSIFEISKVVSATFNQQELLNLVLNSSLVQTGASKGALYLYNESSHEFNLEAIAGLSADSLKIKKSNILLSDWDDCLSDGSALVITSSPNFFSHGKVKCFKKKDTFMNICLDRNEDLICMPMKSKDKIIGIMNVVKEVTENSFSEGDIELLHILVSQAAISLQNAQLFSDLEQTYIDVIRSLTLILEAKSPYTRGHSEGVTRYAAAIARRLKMNEEEIKLIKQGGIFHDIGKIGIKESILSKPSGLTKEEYDIIKEHPVIGDGILKPIGFFDKIRPMVRNHHERMDGQGYPDGLVGKDMTIFMKIMVVADSYDAMASDRPYRKRLSKRKIIEELEQNSSTQFDPEIAKIMIQILEEI
jgi:putative nucleotidyltransferase with HDIG domain